MINILLAVSTACSPIVSSSASPPQDATETIASKPFTEPDFSRWEVSLQDLGAAARKYEDREKAEELLHSAKDAIQENPHVQEQTIIHYRTYEYNRSGKNFPGPEICANDVCIDNQRFILSGMPQNIESAAQYWNVILQQRGCVVVSLHDSSESEDLCNNFWKKESLTQMQLFNGWTITEQEQETVIEDNSCALIKTKLLATNGKETRTLFHLHYTGWPNYTPITNETVFQELLKEMRLLSPNKSFPIAINCHGGVGRTGATAVTYVLEQQISKAVQENKEDEYRVNLAKTVYAFRKQRPTALSNPGNVAKIFSVLEKYYNSLKRNERQSLYHNALKSDPLLSAVGDGE